jgi:hypothetical protein
MEKKWENWERWVKEGEEGYVNPNYKGQDTITITSNPYMIRKFIEKLDNNYINYIKAFSFNFTYSQYRGRIPCPSQLQLDKEFAEKIKIKGFFKWTDKAWGSAIADLSYELP